MKARRRRTVTIEIEERLVLGARPDACAASCPRCGAKTIFLTVDQAALLAGTRARVIYAGVESGAVHFTETPEGLLLVCLNSLPRRCGEAMHTGIHPTQEEPGGDQASMAAQHQVRRRCL